MRGLCMARVPRVLTVFPSVVLAAVLGPCPLAAQDRPALPVQQGLAVGGILRHPRLAKVLLGEDVRGHPGPPGRHRDPFLAEDRGAVGILDLRGSLVELDPRVGTLAFLGESAGDSHGLLLNALRLGSAGETTTTARSVDTDHFRWGRRVGATPKRQVSKLAAVKVCAYVVCRPKRSPTYCGRRRRVNKKRRQELHCDASAGGQETRARRAGMLRDARASRAAET